MNKIPQISVCHILNIKLSAIGNFYIENFAKLSMLCKVLFLQRPTAAQEIKLQCHAADYHFQSDSCL